MGGLLSGIKIWYQSCNTFLHLKMSISCQGNNVKNILEGWILMFWPKVFYQKHAIKLEEEFVNLSLTVKSFKSLAPCLIDCLAESKN